MPGDDLHDQQHTPPSTAIPHQTIDPHHQQHQQQQPRKKRAKIVSACGECRRKKTKCNGEQPCRSCEKSGVACIYPSATQQPGDDKRSHFNKAALESIEERLKTIEDMLRMILQSSQHNPPDLDPAMVHQFLNNTAGAGGGGNVVVTSTPPPPPTTTQRPSSSSSNSSTSSPPNSLQQQHSIRQPSSPPQPIQHLHHSYHHHHHHHQHPSTSYIPPPPPQQQQQQQQQQQRISEYDIRLPSIHNLSAPTSGYHPHEQHPDMVPPPPPPATTTTTTTTIATSTAQYHHHPHSTSSSAVSRPDPLSPNAPSIEQDYGAFQPVKKRKR
ncbi:hypothetical protein RO3G_03127 [Lichtheimia corymbifera JMRC:FSU:9682]|uniref:Zn(2)-C6 fungal-type domain-containing protein n=1 Tax=Lichtheimia corymbifera JMRC:FSU:9682 TaxID=1263082 RepID=A0A068RVK1_9FUNG|nr:hypothetical protein RO3G_03127 [Lichtheimia corymbifera JMRC:FSU:9682]